MKTILLIDDDEICRTPAATMLRRADWNVLEAPDGEQGIELALKHRPDVILCDLLMPRGNGYHVCRTVRQHHELRQTKIVVMTGRDFEADRQTAIEAGADDYLVKPVEFEKLKETLARIAPHAGDPASAPSHRIAADQTTRVKFWGVRGSIPTPGPETVFFGVNTACVEIRTDGEIIIHRDKHISISDN